jgi:hypothetical protein
METAGNVYISPAGTARAENPFFASFVNLQKLVEVMPAESEQFLRVYLLEFYTFLIY